MSTAQQVLAVAKEWLGKNEKDKSFIEILNVYNEHKPLARGYAIKPTDEWCDAFVSAVAIKSGAVEIIGTEVGVPRHIEIFKQKGIWIEDGTITPQPGDIIVYNWKKATQPNNGAGDHIGYVHSVANGTITAIEGNKGEAVSYRTMPIKWGYIRGFARPKYSEEDEEMPDFTNMTDKEVVALLARIEKYLSIQKPDIYAEESCKKGVSSKLFSDGDGDLSIDHPKLPLSRQDAAVLFDRAGLLKKK